VFAPIYVAVPGCKDFPQPPWHDFVVVVLGAFAQAAHTAVSSAAARPLVHFMEGPFAVRIACTGAELEIELIERGTAKSAGRIDRRRFLESILHSGDAVLSACRERKWWSEDEDSLEAAMDVLRIDIRRLSS